MYTNYFLREIQALWAFVTRRVKDKNDSRGYPLYESGVMVIGGGSVKGTLIMLGHEFNSRAGLDDIELANEKCINCLKTVETLNK